MDVGGVLLIFGSLEIASPGCLKQAAESLTDGFGVALKARLKEQPGEGIGSIKFNPEKCLSCGETYYGLFCFSWPCWKARQTRYDAREVDGMQCPSKSRPRGLALKDLHTSKSNASRQLTGSRKLRAKPPVEANARHAAKIVKVVKRGRQAGYKEALTVHRLEIYDAGLSTGLTDKDAQKFVVKTRIEESKEKPCKFPDNLVLKSNREVEELAVARVVKKYRKGVQAAAKEKPKI
jgi:hypothetical protein